MAGIQQLAADLAWLAGQPGQARPGQGSQQTKQNKTKQNINLLLLLSSFYRSYFILPPFCSFVVLCLSIPSFLLPNNQEYSRIFLLIRFLDYNNICGVLGFW